MSSPSASDEGSSTKSLVPPTLLRALDRLRLLAKRPLDGTHKAERRSRHLGTSLEFAEHRNYAGGDDPRMLDWNAYARLDRLFVKLFHEEEAVDVFILLDSSESMRCILEGGADTTRLDYARQLAAAFGYIALVGQHQVSLIAMGAAEIRRAGRFRGRMAFHGILDFLTRDDWSGGRVDLARAVRGIAGTIRRRCVAVVLSDFHGDYQTALRALRHKRLEVIALRIFDPAETGAAWPGDVVLVDSESGEELETTAGPNPERSLAEEEFNAEFLQWCARQEIAAHCASCAAPIENTVLELQQQGFLRR